MMAVARMRTRIRARTVKMRGSADPGSSSTCGAGKESTARLPQTHTCILNAVLVIRSWVPGDPIRDLFKRVPNHCGPRKCWCWIARCGANKQQATLHVPYDSDLNTGAER